jgi:hypothetical protein
MRLQMHAADPDYLEKRLGERDSKGCIRIPATLNAFLDRNGLIDADYERALKVGSSGYCDLTAFRYRNAGRYPMVIDSGSHVRSPWSPAPGVRGTRGTRF